MTFGFSPTPTVIFDHSTFFSALTLMGGMKQYGIKRKTVLAYPNVSTGRAERMVGTLEKAIAKMTTFEEYAGMLRS